MNREQAENILEAYINIECGGGDNKARKSLREVILDAMTEYKTTSNPWTITYPPKPLVTYMGTGNPNVVQPSITSMGVGE